MKTIKLKTIKQLVATVKNGDIDESKLRIILDNDNVSFYCGDEENDPDNFIIIEVEESQGYNDILPLYSLLFQNAKVEWC